MEGEIWRRIAAAAADVQRSLGSRGVRYLDSEYLQEYLWAVLNNRPVYWVSRSPPPSRRRRTRRPSISAVCRRARRGAFVEFIDRTLLALRVQESSSIFVIDSKAYGVGPASHDRSARFGLARHASRRGYKLHIIADAAGQVCAWTATPLDVADSLAAIQILRRFSALFPGATILADSEYASPPLLELAAECGVEVVVVGSEGNRPDSESHCHGDTRDRIERTFGALMSSPMRFYALPPWVRSLPRVRSWMGCKLLIHNAHRGILLASHGS